ncbi:MAG TPA: cytochrome c oxidase assembly protein [Acidimicrobiales bacterium]|nr:cytochrome c oxidase assembly protein [Acidimicrobiales bacterium]
MPALALTPVLAHGAATASSADVVIVFAASLWVLGSVRILTGRPGVRRVVGSWRLIAGFTAFVVLGAVLSPWFDTAADAALWVHMVQHLALGLIAPLLLCVARPTLVFSSVLDPPARRRLERNVAVLRRRWGLRRHVGQWAVAATALHVAGWWSWHVPVVFDLALRHDSVHAAEHATLFSIGLLLWWVCIGVRWDDRGPAAVFVLFGAAVGTGMIGALLTIAPEPVYATTLSGVQRWGLTRLSDQQLGGVIMWVVGGAVYLSAATLVAVRWLLLGPARGQSIVIGTPEHPG